MRVLSAEVRVSIQEVERKGAQLLLVCDSRFSVMFVIFNRSVLDAMTTRFFVL